MNLLAMVSPRTDGVASNVRSNGFTLVEIIVSVGIFALVMLLASGAYIMMIGLNRQAQGIATGIDNVSFALETMTRDIRTGVGYTCPGGSIDCDIDGSTDAFSFTNSKGEPVSYTLSGGALQEDINGSQTLLTDPSVELTALTFYVRGTALASAGDLEQARVTVVVSGSVASSASKNPQTFTVETGATLRGPDI